MRKLRVYCLSFCELVKDILGYYTLSEVYLNAGKMKIFEVY